MANCQTVRDVAANTFRVAANTAGRGCDDPQRDNLYEVEDNFEKLRDVLQHDNLCEVEDKFVKFHDGLPHNLLLEEDTFEKFHDVLLRDNLCVGAGTTEKLHGVLLRDNLCEGAGTTGRLRGVFPLCNQEVLETLKDYNWVALEASRHGSSEVLEAHIQALFLVLREGFI